MQSLLDVEESEWFKFNIARTRATFKDIKEEKPSLIINGIASNFDARLQLGK